MCRIVTRYWIGVAANDHVEKGVLGGFAQLGHGKPASIRRLSPGDWIWRAPEFTHIHA
jgi:hypothetical protein